MKSAEGFGNYIYIIFAVVYVIYSIIQAGKKANKNRPTINKESIPQQPYGQPVQPPTARPVPEHNPGDELKKMLEDLLGGGEEVAIPQRHVEMPIPEPVIAPKPSANFLKKEKKAAYQTKKTEAYTPPAFVAHPEIVMNTFPELAPVEEGAIDFDIRQAIIYSEIMKRPQY